MNALVAFIPPISECRHRVVGFFGSSFAIIQNLWKFDVHHRSMVMSLKIIKYLIAQLHIPLPH